tara:strand:+ start:3115 stop:3735 length:621 start_codon:yes stop_codon:yes gene_type:complete
MKIIKITLFPLFFLFLQSSIAKEYEYKNFLSDNDLLPVIHSSSENSIDIIEFSSFSCSHCAAFHKETLIELKESNLFSHVNYYVVDFSLNQAAFYASMIASCDLSIRPSYIDSVYENYDIWTKAETPERLIELLNSYGLQHGLEEKQLQSCIKNEDLQNNLLSLQIDSQNIFGIESTPTFLIDGEKVKGNKPATEFLKIISKKLNK